MAADEPTVVKKHLNLRIECRELVRKGTRIHGHHIDVTDTDTGEKITNVESVEFKADTREGGRLTLTLIGGELLFAGEVAS